MEKFKSLGSKSVLFIEDDPSSYEEVFDVLDEVGTTVDVAVSQEEAMDYLNKQNYDLVFVDVAIGEGEAHLIEQIRQHGNTKKHTIIIALTEQAFLQERAEALKAGADDYLIKPVRLDHLEDILYEYVEGLSL